MTKCELLDYFAVQAMQAQIAKNNLLNLAETCYKIAENMLEARQRVLDDWSQQEEYKSADIHELKLPVRHFRILMAEGILTKEKLIQYTERDLRKIPNLGIKGMRMVVQALNEAGLKIKGQP